MTEAEVRRMNRGGWVLIGVGLLSWPLIQHLIARGGSPLAVITLWLIALTAKWYLLFVRKG